MLRSRCSIIDSTQLLLVIAMLPCQKKSSSFRPIRCDFHPTLSPVCRDNFNGTSSCSVSMMSSVRSPYTTYHPPHLHCYPDHLCTQLHIAYGILSRLPNSLVYLFYRSFILAINPSNLQCSSIAAIRYTRTNLTSDTH